MANLNQCNFIGNVGSAPTIRSFENGKVATCSIAVTEKYNDRNGNRHEDTEWVPLVFNGSLVDVVEKYVQSGTQLYVSGKMKTRKYTNAQGVEKTVTEVRVRDMILLGGPRSDDEKPKAENRQPLYEAAKAVEAVEAAAEKDPDDLPF